MTWRVALSMSPPALPALVGAAVLVAAPSARAEDTKQALEAVAAASPAPPVLAAVQEGLAALLRRDAYALRGARAAATLADATAKRWLAVARTRAQTSASDRRAPGAP